MTSRSRPKVSVEWSLYGCESGCDGHVVKVDDGREKFEFTAPYGRDREAFARELVAELFPDLKDYDLDFSRVRDD